MSQEYTDQQLIEKYVAMRDLIQVKTKALSEITAPYRKAMDSIEQALMARLIQRGADSTKTDAGTAYKTNILNVKISEREKFLDYALNNEDGLPMLQLAAPQKDAVRDYIDKNNAPPPGVEISYFSSVNIRKS